MAARSRRLFLVGAAGLVGGACGPRPAGPTPAPPTSTIDWADLAQARALWSNGGQTAYRLTVEVVRGQPDDGITEMEVRAGTVCAARHADGKRPAADLTVERLFQMVEEALAAVEAGRLRRLEVMFDGHRGPPLAVVMARPDGPEQRYTVRGYTPL